MPRRGETVAYIKATAAVVLTPAGIAACPWAIWLAHTAAILTGLALLVAIALDRPVSRLVRHPESVLSQPYESLGGYIGGLFVLVLANMVFSGAFLAIGGVRYFPPLAVLAGPSNLVPDAGAIVAGGVLSLDPATGFGRETRFR